MDCPQIPELSYGDFSRNLLERIAGKRVPIAGSLELTFRCNLRCVHCYIGDARQGIPGRGAVQSFALRGPGYGRIGYSTP